MLSNEAIHQQVETLLSQMTLEEKAAQMVQVPYTVVGREEALRWAKLGAGSFLHVLGDDAREVQQAALHSRLGIPVLFGIDAIHGHGLNDHATIFPSQLSCACAWDKDIAREMGEVTAREVATDGLHWTFSPVLCLGRDTRWGRVDETFGEDPYLAGELGEAIVRGYQGDDLSDGEHILACAKHYIGYGEAVGARDACDTEMTYRRLRETFLPPFEKAFRAGCATVMTAYGSIDGTPFTAAADYAVKSFAEEMEGRDLRLEQTVRGRNFLWDGKTAVADIKNLSLTGYQVIKYTLDESKYDGGAKNINSIPLIRYAEVLLNYAEAQAELDKVTDEARKQTEELMKSIAGTNAQTEQSTGIIGKLQARIEALEKKKLLPESTVEDIAAANAEIEKLQKELERIRNIKPEDLKPVVKMDGILPAGFELELPAPKLEMGDLKPVTSQYAQQMQAIFGAVREGLYGWADDNSAYLQEHVADTVSMVENYTTALTAKGWSFSAALEHVHATIAEVMTRFDQQVSKFMADSIVAAAEAIGQNIAGDLGFGGLMKAILTQFANFLKNIGSQLIEFGVMIIAFKSALKSVLANPWAAIAIGAAMVAAAAVMTALINKNAEKSVPALANGGLVYGPTYAMVGDNPNAGTDPEVIAPLSKLQAMLPTSGNAQNLRITLGGQLTAKGRDLVYVLGKENFKSEVLGG